MPRKRLEPKSVSSLKPQNGKRVVVFDTVATGLALRCTENGAKTFFFVYRIDGKASQWLRLGTPAGLSLADAREEVATHRADVLKGIDPIAKRRQAVAAAEAARLEEL